MKIRNRITLWVSLAGLVASAILSVVVFLWGLESPYEFLDQELEIRAHTLADELAREQAAQLPVGGETLEHFSHLYWVRMYDAQGNRIFASKMAREIELPMRVKNRGYLIATDIPLNRFYSDEEDEPTAFWNRVFTVPVSGTVYQVHVARPVESLIGESVESAIMIALALLAATFVLMVVSYLVAGRILRPVQEINRLTSAITEQTLAQRIPLSGNHDEIDALAATLNEMFDRLQYSFLRQKEFVANASHELKTPVTLLRLSLEETLQNGDLPAATQETLLAQERTLARISYLIKSLLDLSRLELTDTLEKETFSLSALITAVVEEFQGLLQEQNLRFTADLNGPLTLHADREKIRRVLINLLDNAIRYNQSQGEIRCQGSTVGNQITLTLANTGPGIDPDDIGHIFDQFYRGEKSRATARGGSGLGLTIVKRIIDMHGGSITVESTPGQWTTLTIHLPAGHEE
jgi:signal transduction histidine kinase